MHSAPLAMVAMLLAVSPTISACREGTRPAEPASASPTGPPPAPPLTEQEMDQARRAVRRCWVVRQTTPEVSVDVLVRLAPDGTVMGMPEVRQRRPADPAGEAVARSAVEAVLRCQPYHLPADKYRTWQRILFTFDTKQLPDEP